MNIIKIIKDYYKKKRVMKVIEFEVGEYLSEIKNKNNNYGIGVADIINAHNNALSKIKTK